MNNAECRELTRLEIIEKGMPEELAGMAMDAWETLVREDQRLRSWLLSAKDAQLYMASFHYFMQGFVAGRVTKQELN